MDANVVHQHLEAIAHHLSHTEAHERGRARENDPAKWGQHIKLAQEHLDHAEKHAAKAGLRRSFVAESRRAHGELRDHDLPSVEHRKFVPHQHDHLVNEAAHQPAHEYRFEIGKHHPMNGKPADESPLPAGAKVGSKQQHLEALDHHVQHAALLSRKGNLTADPQKRDQLHQDSFKHLGRAFAHGAHAGMEQHAVRSILHSKQIGEHELAAAPDKFSSHPHDDKLNLEHHRAAMEHHRDRAEHHYSNYLTHSRAMDTGDKHAAARDAHAKMAGLQPHETAMSAQKLAHQPSTFEHHDADTLVHPAHHWDHADGGAHAIAHHVRFAAGHQEAAENSEKPPEQQAYHANHASKHEEMAVKHGAALGLPAEAVKQRIGWAKQKGAGVPVAHGSPFAGHPHDQAVRFPQARKSEPDHAAAMEHHINHMLAHHDRAVHPEVENDPLTRAHHIGQAEYHRQLAARHGQGEGLLPHEIGQKMHEAAQAPHRVSVPKDSHGVPHDHDRAAHAPDLADRGNTKRLSKEFLHSPQSKSLATGHINHQDAGYKAADPHAAFSHGTKLADHPVYGSVRLKPAHDIFHEKATGEYRPAEAVKANSSAHREVLFHDLMHNHFGLGEHQHHVGMTHHEGGLYSVHEALKDHMTLDDFHRAHREHPHVPSAKEALKPHFDSGKLHQLAAVDYITGNWDRHSGNVMVHRSGGSGKPVQLIDHGLAFPNGPKAHNRNPEKVHFPSHLRPFVKDEAKAQHPKFREWMNNIDENKIHDHILSRGFGKDVAANVHARILNAKALVNQHDDANHAVKAMFNHKLGYQGRPESFEPVAHSSTADTNKELPSFVGTQKGKG